MPKATRTDDCCTGHDSCPPIKLETGSPDVFINSKKAGRQTDLYKPHSCDVHSPHKDKIVGGSKTVFINGLGAARIGDEVILAGKVKEGSENVFIGG